jgi:hypothetical protein
VFYKLGSAYFHVSDPRGLIAVFSFYYLCFVIILLIVLFLGLRSCNHCRFSTLQGHWTLLFKYEGSLHMSQYHYFYCTHLLTAYPWVCLSAVSLCLLLLCFPKPGTISSCDQENPGEGNGLFSVLFLSNLSPWKYPVSQGC